MRVKVLMFARLRDVAGAAELEREVPDGAVIRDVWDGLVEDHAGLEPFTTSVSCARNDDYARMTTTVANGDCIAFLPPVSGG